jgi:hypothetical protein
MIHIDAPSMLIRIVATVILFNESSLKSLTNDNIKNVMTPKIHEAIKSINEGLKI